ncbi:Lymphocyte cytosolic protein 2 [Camponotus floridanus]|uniref:Lymphocyte cytosolic protein 2 n=1 Tax=Camponotus floridanus TaxID=104421 RepID=E2APR2_CAMFO|nr:Lymphocyte cytosolic protein 2 [Camponotus floridanus]
MSKRPSRSEALDDISAWDTEEVLRLLRKNGLEECCNAVMKRQIDGDELLHLTDGKLALWKSDLTRPQIGKLWTFVQELNKFPERYLSNKIIEAQQNDDHLSDSGSWGTDFDDEATEEISSFDDTQETIKPSLIKNKQTLFLQNNRIPISRIPMRSSKKITQPKEEETYANCESSCQDEEENIYANFQETKLPPTRNISRLHSQLDKSLAEKLKEELKHRNNQPTKKPAIGPKPEALSSRKIPITDSGKRLPQKSFLHNAPKTHQHIPNDQRKTQRRMTVPPPPEPKKNKDYTSVDTKKGSDKELPKPPPATIRNFDLVANLPARTEESEDEYETFDENIIEQVQQISRVDSKQSLHSGRQGSIESVYKPPSATSHEEEGEDYEIYESITETPEDNGYLSPIQRTNNVQQEPPPLPAKLSPTLSTPPNSIRLEKHQGNGMCSCFYLRLSKQLLGGLGIRLVDEVADMIVRIKRGLSTCCYSQPPDPPGIRDEFAIMASLMSDTKRNMSLNTAIRRQASLSECLTQAALTQARLNLAKRSPDKKSATVPHADSNTSLSTERATRPLPPPPDKQSLVDKSWYHNVTREQAAALIEEQGTYSNPQDGYFLLRPSTTNIGNPLALVLWYKDRVYNVPVRKRTDNRYALGSAKVNELSFSTIDEIVAFYLKEELMLYSGGVQIGSTRLTDTPPK